MKLIIEPGRVAANYWGDVWRYRELLYFLTWRDIAVRYKQTAIGVAWALLRPAITMTVFVLFRRLMGTPTANVPEPVLVFAAVLPWQFFSSALSESSMSLVGNASLVSKVYFPRLLVPAAAVTAAFADFLITLALLAGLMAWYGLAPGWSVLALPVFVLLAAVLALGSGLCLAALNVEYRDFRYVVPFVIQVALFVSPIAFMTSNVPERWRPLYRSTRWWVSSTASAGRSSAISFRLTAACSRPRSSSQCSRSSSACGTPACRTPVRRRHLMAHTASGMPHTSAEKAVYELPENLGAGMVPKGRLRPRGRRRWLAPARGEDAARRRLRQRSLPEPPCRNAASSVRPAGRCRPQRSGAQACSSGEGVRRYRGLAVCIAGVRYRDVHGSARARAGPGVSARARRVGACLAPVRDGHRAMAAGSRR